MDCKQHFFCHCESALQDPSDGPFRPVRDAFRHDQLIRLYSKRREREHFLGAPFFVNPNRTSPDLELILNTTATDHREPHPHPNPPPEGEGILWGFLTFMEVFPIPPLSRGRSGGGWGIYVAVVLGKCHCERSEAIRLFCGIATHLSGARNDDSGKGFYFLNQDFGSANP